MEASRLMNVSDAPAYGGAGNDLSGSIELTAKLVDDLSQIASVILEHFAFKNARLKVVSAKTLKDGDLPGIKSVFGWAVDNRKLTKNPADAIKVKSEKKIRTRRRVSRTRKPKRYSKLALHTSESRRRTPGLLLPNAGLHS